MLKGKYPINYICRQTAKPYCMTYRAIGLMSGSSLDGLDLVFAEFTHQGGEWSYSILAADCFPYPAEWKNRLQEATGLSALDYQLLHTAYGHYLGEEVNRFIDAHNLHFKVSLVASHGHTTFHLPGHLMTAQLGDGASIAAVTGLPVVSDLRALDVAFGGQGAPIVPMGERLLLPHYPLFLNIGGIANVSVHQGGRHLAYDICPANRVLNLLAEEIGKPYDESGATAAGGQVNEALLQELNELDYYRQPYPKSLANTFGTDVVFPMVKKAGLSAQDSLRTVVAHVAEQVKRSLTAGDLDIATDSRLLVTGGGAFNTFLVSELEAALRPAGITVEVPYADLVQYKEALIMGLLGVLRWRQEYTVMSSVTGASRDSIGGAVWIGQEA
jgi:anhydro-N-acetylmuramic acid kinase